MLNSTIEHCSGTLRGTTLLCQPCHLCNIKSSLTHSSIVGRLPLLTESLQILISLLMKPNMGHCGLIFTIKISNYVISQIQALHMLTRISRHARMIGEGVWMRGMMRHQTVHRKYVFLFKQISKCVEEINSLSPNVNLNIVVWCVI